MKFLKNRRLIVIAIVLLLGVVAVARVSGPWRSRGAHAGHPAKAVYYCPMHPTYTSDRPGDCPICNMKLIRKEPEAAGQGAPEAVPQTAEDICYMHNCPMEKAGEPCPMLVVAKEGEEVTCPVCGTHVVDVVEEPVAQPGALEGYAQILITPQKRQFIGIATAPVERRSIHKLIRTVGQIANDPELYQAQQEHVQALRTLEQAQAGADPALIEWAQRLADSSGLRLRRMGLNDELIEELASREGPDQSLILADPDGRVWLYAAIYEFELPLVKVGQAVSVEAQAVPGMKIDSVIRSIDPVLDPVTRSARVRAILIDPQKILKPDMFVNASIQVDVKDVLTVPEEAVFDTGAKKIVFVDKGQGIFEPRGITVGMKADGAYEVRSGVSEGEAVVTSGNFLIDSESRLKSALQGMSGAGHQHGQ